MMELKEDEMYFSETTLIPNMQLAHRKSRHYEPNQGKEERATGMEEEMLFVFLYLYMVKRKEEEEKEEEQAKYYYY